MKTTKNFHISLIYIISLTLLLSCSDSSIQKFPLCSKLSKTKPSPISNVTKTVFNICKEKNIQITIMSDNIAEFRGSKKEMKWLQDNYHILICDFSQDSTSLLGAKEFMSCMSHAKDWIRIAQSDTIGNLMLPQTNFCPICMSKGNCF